MNVKSMNLESMDGSVIVSLPSLLECGSMVNDRGEIADPTKFCFHPHLAPVAKIMPEIEPDAEMGLLIGRDIPQLHKVLDTINGPPDSPWGESLEIGWVVMGDMCLDPQPQYGAHVLKTHVNQSLSPSFKKCKHVIKVEERVVGTSHPALTDFQQGRYKDRIGQNVFVETKDDNKQGTSVEDRQFIHLMNHSMGGASSTKGA